MSVATKVVVKNVPEQLERDKLFMYFQTTKSGGGDGKIKSFVYPVPDGEGKAAVIEYKNESIAKKVLTMVHEVKGKSLRCAKFQPGIFESAEVRLNKSMFEELTAQQGDLRDFMDDAGVTWDNEDGSILLKGEWHQLLCVGEKMKQLSLQSNPEESGSEVDLTPASKKSCGYAGATSVADDHDVINYPSLDNEGLAKLQTNEKVPEREKDSQLQADTNSDAEDSEDPSSYGSAYGDCVVFQGGEETGFKGLTQSSVGGAPVTDHAHSTAYVKSETVDKDIVEFMSICRKQEMDDFRILYKMEFVDAGEDVDAVFHGNADWGLSGFLKLYHDVKKDAKQESFKIPEGIRSEEVKAALSRCRRRCPTVHISELANETMLCIGSSSSDVGNAIMCFREEIEKERKNYFAHEPPSQALFSHAFSNCGPRLTVYQGDIAEQDVHAIVNAANARLRNGGGVTGAIFRAGGWEFAEACRQLMRDRDGRELKIGEVVCTAATGVLQCAWVLHVVGPMWGEYSYFGNKEKKCEKHMGEVCSNLINKAVELGVHTVAIPAIGTGIYGVPLQYFCDAMWNSTTDFCRQLEGASKTSPLEIRIVNYDSVEANEIAKSFRSKLRPGEGIKTRGETEL